jgi:hypothetical protein
MSLKKAFKRLKTKKTIYVAGLACISGFSLLLKLIGLQTLFLLAVFLPSLAFLLKKHLRKLKLSPKLRYILFELSLFDKFCDLVYYPVIPKYISAFLVPIITKPDPDQLKQKISDLDPSVQRFFFRKGLIHLLPSILSAPLLK